MQTYVFIDNWILNSECGNDTLEREVEDSSNICGSGLTAKAIIANSLVTKSYNESKFINISKMFMNIVANMEGFNKDISENEIENIKVLQELEFKDIKILKSSNQIRPETYDIAKKTFEDENNIKTLALLTKNKDFIKKNEKFIIDQIAKKLEQIVPENKAVIIPSSYENSAFCDKYSNPIKLYFAKAARKLENRLTVGSCGGTQLFMTLEENTILNLTSPLTLTRSDSFSNFETENPLTSNDLHNQEEYSTLHYSKFGDPLKSPIVSDTIKHGIDFSNMQPGHPHYMCHHKITVTNENVKKNELLTIQENKFIPNSLISLTSFKNDANQFKTYAKKFTNGEEKDYFINDFNPEDGIHTLIKTNDEGNITSILFQHHIDLSCMENTHIKNIIELVFKYNKEKDAKNFTKELNTNMALATNSAYTSKSVKR